MKTFWRTLWIDARFGLTMGIVMTGITALPHKPTIHNALIYCTGSVVGAVIGSLLFGRLFRPKRSSA